MATRHPTIGKAEQGNIAIDLAVLLETRLLVQASSGGGKSWAIRRLVEQTANHVQQIIIDSEGDFATLRERFDYVIAAPHDGDAVATPRTAALLARRLLETGVSAIINIFELKKADREAFVQQFLDAMINAPKKLWHPVLVVLDEAHVFAPEKGKTLSKESVIDMATRGRKRGQCLVAATQRLAKLSKDVAAECINKLIGRTVLDVDVRRASEELGFVSRDERRGLRLLEPGDFFVFGPALNQEVARVRVGPVSTTHPRPGERLMAPPPAPSIRIRKVLAELADLPQDAQREALTIEALSREVSQLRAELKIAHRKASQVGIPEHEVQRRERQAAAAARAETLATQRVQQAGMDTKTARELTRHLSKALALIDHLDPSSDGVSTKPSVPIRPSSPATKAHRSASGMETGTAGIEGLRKGAVRMLKELAARYPAGYSRAQVGVLARISPKGGTFTTYLGDLRRNGFIREQDELVYATEGGIHSLGSQVPSAPTTHEQAMQQWRRALRAGAFRMLEAVVGAGPGGISRDNIAMAAGIEITGGTFTTYLGDLRRNGLITESGGLAVANDILFPG